MTTLNYKHLGEGREEGSKRKKAEDTFLATVQLYSALLANSLVDFGTITQKPKARRFNACTQLS